MVGECTPHEHAGVEVAMRCTMIGGSYSKGVNKVARKKRGVEPISVSVEEVVAKAVNLGYAPDMGSVDDMLAAFLEDSEYELSQRGTYIESPTSPDQIQIQIKADADKGAVLHERVTRKRVELARAIREALTYEIGKKGSKLKVTNERTPRDRINMKEANEWLREKFGIDLRDWAPPTPERRREMTDEEREAHLRMLALFVREDIRGKSVNQFAEHLAKHNYEGFSQSKIRDAINLALKSEEDFPFIESNPEKTKK